MKKLWILLIISIIFPINVFALNNKYNDNVAEIVGMEKNNEVITVYLFHSDTCPHCAAEREWISSIKDTLENVKFVSFEVSNSENLKKMDKVISKMKLNVNGVPLTIIGDKIISGWSTEDVTGAEIMDIIEYYKTEDAKETNTKNLPILGKVDMKNVSLTLVAIVLGFIDGFNPCAMWILLFLINMLIGMKNKKRMWMLGITFLFTSALIYLLSMYGISFVLKYATSYIKIAVGVFAIITGVINLKKYIEERKDNNKCSVIDDKKRKSVFDKVKKFTQEKSFVLAMAGVIALAVSVNLIELACSLGLPTTFTELLVVNNVTGIGKFIYMLIYILFYMADDLIVFIISMVSLEAFGLTTKYGKLVHLIGGILMILMGILLVFKPEWLMLNFG